MVLALMVFVPIKYIYPSRTEPLRRVTLALADVVGGGDTRADTIAARATADAALHVARLRPLLLCNVIRTCMRVHLCPCAHPGDL